jgi:hypothetical protein
MQDRLSRGWTSLLTPNAPDFGAGDLLELGVAKSPQQTGRFVHHRAQVGSLELPA